MNHKSVFFQELWMQLSNRLDILVLRNYEYFPQNLGNDLDFLVSKDSLSEAVSVCREVADNFNFKLIESIKRNNSLLSVSFAENSNSLDFIKVDFFSGLTKGWFAYANTNEVLNKKITFKEYYVPNLTHEAYLLLMKELFMYGRLRERYFDKFTSKYKNIDFKEVYQLSSGLIRASSIARIENEYTDIHNLVFYPQPTIKNFVQPIKAAQWIYNNSRYRFLNHYLKN